MTINRLLIMASAVLGCLSTVSQAGFVISFDAPDLQVSATGGIVTQAIDLRITHSGVGSNLLSAYEIEFAPDSARAAVVLGTVTSSDFVFDLGHLTVGDNASTTLTGATSGVANQTVTFGSTNLLARIFVEVDTSAGFPSTVDLRPTLRAATRNGAFGDDIRTEFTLNSSPLAISAVPEPGCGILGLVLASAALGSRALRRGRRAHTRSARLLNPSD